MGFFEGLPQAAQEHLHFLTEEFGFKVVESSDEVVRFESPLATVTATFYPDDHGQLDVIIEPSAPHSETERLVIGRMVGRASVSRIVQLAANDLRANEPALRGDRSAFAN